MAGELDEFEGRKPSIGFGKNGPYTQGFRSKPGAPMQDPTTNNPMSGTYQPTNWDSVFQPRMGGTSSPTAPASPTPGTPSQTQPAQSGGWLDSYLKNASSLETMASGGASHAQKWSNPSASKGWETTGASKQWSIFDRYKSNNTPDHFGGFKTFEDSQQRPGVGRTASNGFGWGSAFS